MKFLVVTLSFLGFFASQELAADSVGQHGGIWASRGQPLSSPSKVIWAPNREVGLEETPKGLSVVGKRRVLLEKILSPPSLTEVVWASDSKSFVVNGSDGGAVGTWEASFYSLSSDAEPMARNLGILMDSKIRDFPKCIDPEVANFGVAGWMNKGRELLVVVEAPPHSSCRNGAAIEGFRVDIAEWKIVAQIPEQQLRRNWAKILGNRFAQ